MVHQLNRFLRILGLTAAAAWLSSSPLFGQSRYVDNRPVNEKQRHAVVDPQGQRAHFTVEVNPDAEVWIEGQKMSQSGPRRQFMSPPLARGYKFDYEIKARWNSDGKEIERTRHLRIEPGDRVAVNFRESESEELPTIVGSPGGTPMPPAQFGGGMVTPGLVPQQPTAATNTTVVVPGGIGGFPIFPQFDRFNPNRPGGALDPFRTGLNDPRAQVPYDGTPQTPGTGRTQPPTQGSGTPQTPGTGVTVPDIGFSPQGTVQPQGATPRPGARPGSIGRQGGAAGARGGAGGAAGGGGGGSR